MIVEDFYTYLLSASFSCTRFAEDYVKNKLHYKFKYLVKLNKSCDVHADEENDLYPEDDGKELKLDEEKEVVELLLRKGKIPEWIDISVKGVGKDYTLLELLCCGRYTAKREKMYYTKHGQGPFGIKSPTFPPRHIEGEKFKIGKV